MNSYYYLVAQLPFLTFPAPVGISGERFLEEARKWVEGKEARLLCAARLFDVSLTGQEPAEFKEYKKRERDLRRQVSLLRAPETASAARSVSRQVRAYVAEGNPLQVEVRLMRIRWQWIEELQTDHHFDIIFLLFYYIKIQILERLETFNKEKGMERFSSLSQIRFLSAQYRSKEA